MPEVKLTPEEELTLSSYDAVPGIWAEAHADPFFWLEQLITLKRYLPSGRVLEIGAGGGRDAQVLAALGYDYTGVDASKGLLIEAKKRNPSLTFSNQNIYDLDFPENYFDGFWCSATLLHIPRPRIDEALTQIHKVIRPDGIGFISIKDGWGEETLIEEVLGNTFERYFVYYSEQQFTEVLQRNKYKIVATQTRPMSEKTTWLCYLVEVQK